MPDLPADQKLNSTPPSAVPASGKETEPFVPSEANRMEENSGEIKLSPELEKAGIRVPGETIELPPDLKNMGVEAIGPAQPVNMPTVQLPITDDRVVAGNTQPAGSSWYWLALWCLRQLKKAHVGLKKIGNRIVRQPIN